MTMDALLVHLNGIYQGDQHLTFPSVFLRILHAEYVSVNVKAAHSFLSRFDLACYFRLPRPADNAAWPPARGPQSSLPVASLNSTGIPSKEKSGAS